MTPRNLMGRKGRFTAVATVLLASMSLQACVVTRNVALKDLQVESPSSERPRLWLRAPEGHLWRVYRIDGFEYPTVLGTLEGWATSAGDSPMADVLTPEQVAGETRPLGKKDVQERLDLDQWEQARVVSQTGSVLATIGTTVAIVGGTAATIAFVVLIVLLLTKTSCPFVYVEDADGRLSFVGEAYSGSTGFATARDDLLPLPQLPPGDRRIVLTDEADETQYTDRLELWLVDHPRDTRALAAADGTALLVGAPTPPLAATDLLGNDLLPLLRDADDQEWRTDLDAAAAQVPEPTREGVVLRFPALLPGARPVLELDLGNTAWLDLVVGRIYASAGNRLSELQRREDDPAQGPTRWAWREREGLDLRVESWTGDSWERVTTVPSVGPASRRTLAVPLPARPGEQAVRLTGGVGFWRLDRAALTQRRDTPFELLRLVPTTARQSDGGDARALLAASDAVPHVLTGRGEALELRFRVPAAAPDRLQTAFLSTRGWYHVHRPPKAQLDLARARSLRDEEGSVARFGLELWREYRSLAQASRSRTLAAPR